MESPRPKLATTVLVFRDGKILLGKRIGDADGMFGTPGGHLENLETFAEGARREVMEEAGIEIENITPIGLTNIRQFAPRHYVLIILRADWKSGEVRTLEPDRCASWEWYDPREAPSPLTPATQDAVHAFLYGQVFFDPVG